jgi:hypothetical protein
MTHYPPKHDTVAFHCPNCGVYANQYWGDCNWLRNGWGQYESTEVTAAKCAHCEKFSYWYQEKLLVPSTGTVELPNPDLPATCKEEFLEARDIVNVSPRGAAALLRLCIQNLLKYLGKSGKNINEDISSLVKDGLPLLVQQSLDICRVVGNNAVHPGELNIQDTPEIANTLFQLINVIAYDRITRPNEVKALYDSLPEGARAAIGMRDGA